MMVVIYMEAPRAASPLPTSSSKTFLEAVVFNPVLLTLPLFVEVELVPAGLGAMSLSPEERNTLAARMCPALLLASKASLYSFDKMDHSYSRTITVNVYPLIT